MCSKSIFSFADFVTCVSETNFSNPRTDMDTMLLLKFGKILDYIFAEKNFQKKSTSPSTNTNLPHEVQQGCKLVFVPTKFLSSSMTPSFFSLKFLTFLHFYFDLLYLSAYISGPRANTESMIQ